jgi:hypothetical protein
VAAVNGVQQESHIWEGSMAKEKAKADDQEGGNINKMETVRKTLETLGSDAKPAEIQQYLKNTFNLVMPTTMISSYKTSILKRSSGKSGMMRRGGSRGGDGISVEDIRAIKDLTERLGSNKVQELAKVLAD